VIFVWCQKYFRITLFVIFKNSCHENDKTHIQYLSVMSDMLTSVYYLKSCAVRNNAIVKL